MAFRYLVKGRRMNPPRPKPLCREYDPELWFPLGKAEDKPDAQFAKSVCFVCPLRQACLDHAMKEGILDGIWGGLTETERRALYRRGEYRVPRETSDSEFSDALASAV